MYNSLPHMLTEVVYEARKSYIALKWVVKEIERRLEVLATERVRNIGSYHQIAKRNEAMPYIMIVVDQLGDAALQYPKEVEAVITKMFQNCEVVGIIPVFSTQDLNNALIKKIVLTYFQSKICFKSSIKESKWLLCTQGAEKLSGREALLLTSELKFPVFIQTTPIDIDGLEREIKRMTLQHPSRSMLAMVDPTNEDSDDLYESAKSIAIESGKVSTSFLQRKLGVGYSRAAHLIDLLEDHGVIGPANGMGAREVILTRG